MNNRSAGKSVIEGNLQLRKVVLANTKETEHLNLAFKSACSKSGQGMAVGSSFTHVIEQVSSFATYSVFDRDKCDKVPDLLSRASQKIDTPLGEPIDVECASWSPGNFRTDIVEFIGDFVHLDHLSSAVSTNVDCTCIVDDSFFGTRRCKSTSIR